MGHVDKGDAQLIFQPYELILHVLAQLQIQGAQGLVQEEHAGLVHNGPGDGDPLLLSAGEGGHVPVFIAGEIDQLQGIFDLVVNVGLGLVLDFQAKGNIFRNIHVGKEGVLLKYGI